MVSPGGYFGEPAREGRGVTVPLDTVNDIRSMDAAGRSRSEAARVLHVSRNTVAKYADMEDMSPAAPMPQRRGRPALEGNEEWGCSYGFVNQEMASARLNRGMLTPDHSAGELQSARSASTRRRRAPCPTWPRR